MISTAIQPISLQKKVSFNHAARFGRVQRALPADLETKMFDVFVIGGGINGATTTRDLALRGASVIVADKSDPTRPSNNSTRLMHPGIRYLKHGEFGLVAESIREIKHMFNIAPHLIRPVGMIIPSYQGDSPSYFMLKLGMLIYDVFAFVAGLKRHQRLSKMDLLKRVPTLANPEKLQGGFRYEDGQITYVERLYIENLQDAKAHQATVLRHTEVTRIQEKPDCVELTLTDRLDGKRHKIRTKYVVNATGPGVDEIEALTESKHKVDYPQMGPTKGTHILVPNTIGLKDAVYAPAQDGRPFFVIPFPVYQPQYLLVGTTDDRVKSKFPTKEEVQYLIQSANHRLSGLNLTQSDVFAAYSGFRPLPASTQSTGAVTRKHIIRRVGKGRIFRIIGGKITTSRNLARQVSDTLLSELLQDAKGRGEDSRYQQLKARRRCVTHLEKLPGARGIANFEDYKAVHRLRAMTRYGVSSSVADELIHRYGSQYRAVLDLIKEDSHLAEPLTHSAPIIKAQVLYAIRHENAETLMDIMTESLKLDLTPGAGLDGVQAAAILLQKEKQLTPPEVQQEIEIYRNYIAQTMAWR